MGVGSRRFSKKQLLSVDVENSSEFDSANLCVNPSGGVFVCLDHFQHGITTKLLKVLNHKQNLLDLSLLQL